LEHQHHYDDALRRPDLDDDHGLTRNSHHLARQLAGQPNQLRSASAGSRRTPSGELPKTCRANQAINVLRYFVLGSDARLLVNGKTSQRIQQSRNTDEGSPRTAFAGLTSPRDRGVMTTYDPDIQEQDPSVLQRIVNELDASTVLDNSVITQGRIRVGDPVEIIEG
jgi:hypothetical protein